MTVKVYGKVTSMIQKIDLDPILWYLSKIGPQKILVVSCLPFGDIMLKFLRIFPKKSGNFQ